MANKRSDNKAVFGAYLDVEIKERFREICESKGVTMTDELGRLIELELHRVEKRNQSKSAPKPRQASRPSRSKSVPASEGGRVKRSTKGTRKGG